jgi:hypothetical protein
MTMTTTQNLTPGTKVRIIVSANSPFLACAWWPTTAERDGRFGSVWVRRATEVTGTVQKVYKNGSAAVAVDQIRNASEDGLKTLSFKVTELEAM